MLQGICMAGVTRGECACSCAGGALRLRDVRGGRIGGLADASATGCSMRDLARIESSRPPLVPVVKSANFGEHHHATVRRRMDASWRGRVFLEGEVGSRPMIIGGVSSSTRRKCVWLRMMT
jgi:hypothetical protein